MPVLQLICRPLGRAFFCADEWAQKDLEKQREKKLMDLEEKQPNLQEEHEKLLSQQRPTALSEREPPTDVV
jgi:hypothetical protein